MSVLLPKPFILGSRRKPVTNADPLDPALLESQGYLIEEMEQIKEKGEYTPDFPLLLRKSHHYVFVYGTLKKSFRNHYFLGRSELVGCGYTKHDRFFMARDTLGCFPVAFFDNRPENRARIYGEVYQVVPNTIKTLDNLESNGKIYKRHPLEMQIVQRDGKEQTVRAWIYLGVKDYWGQKSDRLEFARRIKPNNEPIVP